MNARRAVGVAASLAVIALLGRDGLAERRVAERGALPSITSKVRWERLAAPRGYSLEGVSFANQTVGVIVGQTVGLRGAILSSEDSGRHFHRVALLSSDSNLAAVTLLQNGVGYAVGTTSHGGVVLRSADQGRTWASEALPAGTAGFQAVATRGTRFVIAAGATLALTTNRARSWTILRPPRDMDSIAAVAFAGRRIVLAGAWSGGPLVAYSDEQGRTWKEVRLRDANLRLSAMHFDSGSDGWIGGSYVRNGGVVLLHTRNAGQRWNKIRAPGRTLLGLWFADSNRGWIATEAGESLVGEVRSTVDGARSWQRELHLPGLTPGQLFFLRGTGWMVGSKGVFRR